MDIRRLVGSPPDQVYDTGSGVITLSGRLPPSPPVVLPLDLNRIRKESADWKVGLVAVILAGAVVLSLSLAVLLRDTEEFTAPPPPGSTPAAAIVATNADEEIVPSSVASPEGSDGERRRSDDADVGENDDVGPPSLPAGATEGSTTTSTDEVTRNNKKNKTSKKSTRKKKSKAAGSVLAFAEPAADGPRPKTLNRAQVKAGMSRVAGKVKRCGKGKSGLLVMDVVIGKSGRVVRATPTGALAGTKAGKCASRVVRQAKFPAFTGQRIGVKYPFRL
jgi:hypothetical protein